MKKVLKVEGMSCMHCSGRVTRALEELDGVTNVDVSLDEGTATVEYDDSKVDVSKMEAAVEDAGYDVVG